MEDKWLDVSDDEQVLSTSGADLASIMPTTRTSGVIVTPPPSVVHSPLPVLCTDQDESIPQPEEVAPFHTDRPEAVADTSTSDTTSEEDVACKDEEVSYVFQNYVYTVLLRKCSNSGIFNMSALRSQLEIIERSELSIPSDPIAKQNFMSLKKDVFESVKVLTTVQQRCEELVAKPYLPLRPNRYVVSTSIMQYLVAGALVALMMCATSGPHWFMT